MFGDGVKEMLLIETRVIHFIQHVNSNYPEKIMCCYASCELCLYLQYKIFLYQKNSPTAFISLFISILKTELFRARNLNLIILKHT